MRPSDTYTSPTCCDVSIVCVPVIAIAWCLLCHPDKYVLFALGMVVTILSSNSIVKGLVSRGHANTAASLDKATLVTTVSLWLATHAYLLLLYFKPSLVQQTWAQAQVVY